MNRLRENIVFINIQRIDIPISLHRIQVEISRKEIISLNFIEDYGSLLSMKNGEVLDFPCDILIPASGINTEKLVVLLNTGTDSHISPLILSDEYCWRFPSSYQVQRILTTQSLLEGRIEMSKYISILWKGPSGSIVWKLENQNNKEKGGN